MGIIGTIFIGLIVGLLARFLKPGDDSMGWIMTILLGIAGSLAATYGGQALGIYQAGQGAGFIGALIGAIVLLVIYGLLKKCASSPLHHADRSRPPAPAGRVRGQAAQAEAPGTEPQQLLHGCEVPRLLPDHHRVLACVHRCVLRRLLHRAVPAHRRQGAPD